MDQLNDIKQRLANISLAGWECFHDESSATITIRFGSSFIEFPADTLYKISFDPNTAEFIKFAPQDMMDLIHEVENK
jgi:hypothetical protein